MNIFSATAYALLSVALVKLFLLDSAIRRQATIDCIARFDDFFLLDLVVVGTFEDLSHLEKMLIEFFRIGFEIHFFLIRFRRHLFEAFDFDGMFDNDFFFDFLRLFNLFFYLFFLDFGRSFGLIFFLLRFLFFGRSFGGNFLFGFGVLLRFHLFDIVLFFLVFLFVFELLSVFVAVDFVLFEIHLTDAEEVGKLLVIHVHIRFALVVQTLEHHCVEGYHTVEPLRAFGVYFVVLNLVGR